MAINKPVTDKGLVIEGLLRQPPLGNHLTSGLFDIRVDRFLLLSNSNDWITLISVISFNRLQRNYDNVLNNLFPQTQDLADLSWVLYRVTFS